MNVNVRWMIRRDMFSVLAIEDFCFPCPWQLADFSRVLANRNCIGMVAEDQHVVGYMIYEIHKTRIHLMNIAVAPGSQRKGVASAMVRKLIYKLSENRRTRISLVVREGNLPAQMFFKSMGFRAIGTVKDYFTDSDEVAYQMQYCVEQHQPSSICEGFRA